MDKHAVVKVVGSTRGREIRVVVMTPWTYNGTLIDASLAAHREIDPRGIYSSLSLPDSVVDPRKRR